MPMIQPDSAREPWAIKASEVSCRASGNGAGPRRWILRRISLEVRYGQALLVSGPSGAGKTTLARILAGLQPPASGEVRYWWSPAAPQSGEPGEPPGRGPRVVLLFQYPERQFFAATVGEELAWGLRQGLKLPAAAIAERMRAAAAAVGLALESIRDRRPRQLSTGEQRRLALASLLTLEPEVMILDEPLAGLNHSERSELVQCLRRWLQPRRSLVVVGHQPQHFLDWVQAVAFLHQGRLIFHGSPAAMVAAEHAELERFAYLPAVAAVLAALWGEGGLAELSCLSPRKQEDLLAAAVRRLWRRRLAFAGRPRPHKQEKPS